ncbi:MAG: accessory gene regulator B family protein [Bacilli bacterium]
MRSIFMKKVMNFIQNNNDKYDNEQLEIIQYGLESIYITITKSIIIFFIAFLMGIVKELFIFMLFYNLIRMPAFGLHATKSSYCLISSTIIFIGSTILAKVIVIPIYIKVILTVIIILCIYNWAPADTHKRPIVNKKRREIYKTLATIIAITFSFTSILITNQFLANCLIISLLVECFMISPHVYKLFKLPYNNYKNYLNYGLN